MTVESQQIHFTGSDLLHAAPVEADVLMLGPKDAPAVALVTGHGFRPYFVMSDGTCELAPGEWVTAWAARERYLFIYMMGGYVDLNGRETSAPNNPAEPR